MFFGRKASPFSHQIFCTLLCPKSSIFVSSFYSTCSQKQFSLSKNILVKLNWATMGHDLWREVCCDGFLYNPFLFKQCYIVWLLTLILWISKLLAVSFKTTLGFILTSWHSFHAVLRDNLAFLSCPGKFSVMPKCLNFFIMDCIIDLQLANWFEIVV